MAKSVSKAGNESLHFLGAAEPTERGAIGMLAALKMACCQALGDPTFDTLIRQATSLVTDGTSANTGEKRGLWSLVEMERKNRPSACGASQVESDRSENEETCDNHSTENINTFRLDM